MRLVSVSTECRSDGSVTPALVRYMDVKKETNKLYILDVTPKTGEVSKEAFGYRRQFYKTEMNSMQSEEYTTRLRFNLIDVASDEQHLEDMKFKVESAVRKALDKRYSLIESWREELGMD